MNRNSNFSANCIYSRIAGVVQNNVYLVCVYIQVCMYERCLRKSKSLIPSGDEALGGSGISGLHATVPAGFFFFGVGIL